MENISRSIFLLSLFLILSFANIAPVCDIYNEGEGREPLRSCPFQQPAGFKFGCATASYQVEGAVEQDGRTPSIWDTFSHTPNKIAKNQTGDVADNQYNLYKQDINLLKQLGVDYYRMSISWSRIFNTDSQVVNENAIRHYRDVFTQLRKNNIEPVVTLYHWDLPQYLQSKFNGWVDQRIIDYYFNYTTFVMDTFKDEVKYWVTFNEIYIFAQLGNGFGDHAPGRCSDRSKCEEGNSAIEPYLVAHHALLAHAKVYRYVKEHMKDLKVGMAINSDFALPYNESSKDDIEAVNRYIEFQMGWIADPLVFGDYPASMKKYVGNRLPQFTENQKVDLKESFDFLGINHYTTRYVKADPDGKPTDGWYYDRHCSASTENVHGETIGKVAQSSWLYVYPKGIRGLLNWVNDRYNKVLSHDRPIWITENGVDAPNEYKMTVEEVEMDIFRQEYIHDYVTEVFNAAIEDNVPVNTYIIWSFIDNFEWAEGYDSRFGLFYVDYTTQERIPKRSTYCFYLLTNNCFPQQNGEWIIPALIVIASFFCLSTLILIVYLCAFRIKGNYDRLD